MPLTHVVLDPDGPPIPIAEARARVYARGDRERYTPELFDAMLATRQERDYISTTSLTSKCLRQSSLQRKVDYTESLDSMWAAFRGTMFHGQLEVHVGDDAFEEARFHTDLEVDGEVLHLSGSPDLVTKGGLLYDYKFTKEAPRFGPWKEHGAQCNINRWLVDHATMVEWRGWRFFAKETGQHPVPIEGKVQEDSSGVTFAEDFRPVDWQGLYLIYMDDKGVTTYLVTKSIDVPKVGGVGTKRARVSDVWDDDYAEDYIVNRYLEVHDAVTLGNTPPIPAGFENQSHPLCAFCPLRNECARLEKEGK